MGTDIHLYVEKKLPDGDWVFIQDLNKTIIAEGLAGTEGMGNNRAFYWKASSRNYNMFSLLAGVRGPGPDPKGLPTDVSSYVWYEHECMGSDAHSASWSTPLEFMEAYIQSHSIDDEHSPMDKYVQVRITDGVQRAVGKFMYEMCSVDMDDNLEHRFVYWFDN